MADVAAREEKLAAARKKLKKFQQRKTPGSTPTSNTTSASSSTSESLNGSVSPNSEPQCVQETPKSSPQPEKPSNEHRNANAVDTVDNRQFTPGSTPLRGVDSQLSSTEKIKQICKRLNGLVNQDLNGDDPIIKEIETLEKRNHYLEDALLSHKRSVEQLNNQVNEQRKQIIKQQDDLTKERNQVSNKQLQEQRSLKEQLEVHIQTIGILVAEKSELQSTNAQLNRRYQIKESENSELSNRLQTVRQRTVELERQVANLGSSSDKFQEQVKQLRAERDKLLKNQYSINREKEDLTQQNSELSEKLNVKISEASTLEKDNVELSFKLKQAELIVQQLSNEPSAASAQNLARQLQDDKAILENKLDQQLKSLQRIAAEKGELQERYNNDVEDLNIKNLQYKEKINQLELDKEQLAETHESLQEQIRTLQTTLDEVQDNDASQQSEATQLAASEIQKLADEKEHIQEELLEKLEDSKKINELCQQQAAKITELHRTVSRLEEELGDRASVLEGIQSDKETISVALKQNKDLKTQVEELEDRFIKMSNTNMELTSQLQSEQYAAKEVAQKMSNTEVELAELKELLSRRDEELSKLIGETESLTQQVNAQSTSHTEEVTRLQSEAQTFTSQIQDQLLKRDEQVSALQSELDRYAKMVKDQAKLEDQLLTAEDLVEQLTKENNQLKDYIGERESSSGEESLESVDLENGEADVKNFKGNSDYDQEEIVVKKSTLVEDSPVPYLNGDIHEMDSSDNESGDDLDMQPQHYYTDNAPPNKFTSKADMVDSLSASIRQLEMERDQLSRILQQLKGQHEKDIKSVREHMELQLHQQVQIQQRHLQEQYHQQLHDQQHRIQALQELLDKHREEQEILNNNAETAVVPYETLRYAFNQLQNRFLGVMGEKASLIEKVQDLEHINMQLSEETETIGEYINLYHTQRQALKVYYHEREKIINQLSNEKGHMQLKISQLQTLVLQLINNSHLVSEQNKQLQQAVNRRMSVLGHNQPGLFIQEGDEIITGPESLEVSKSEEEHEESVHSADSDSVSLDRLDSSESNNLSNTPDTSKEEDGTAQQILQLFQQLGQSHPEEGWLSPGVRNRVFSPCKHCSGPAIEL